MRHGPPMLAALVCGALAACAPREGAENGAESAAATPAQTGGETAGEMGGARAALRDSANREVGELRLEPGGDGVRVTGRLTGLPPGEHGIHLHAVGTCEPPAFTSAGGHFNPGGKQHGFENPAGPHAGDLRNIAVGADSSAQVELTAAGATLDSAATGLLDGDGAAVVVHAGPDDYRTDPAGDSGARIACGVVQR